MFESPQPLTEMDLLGSVQSCATTVDAESGRQIVFLSFPPLLSSPNQQRNTRKNIIRVLYKMVFNILWFANIRSNRATWKLLWINTTMSYVACFKAHRWCNLLEHPWQCSIRTAERKCEYFMERVMCICGKDAGGRCNIVVGRVAAECKSTCSKATSAIRMCGQSLRITVDRRPPAFTLKYCPKGENNT